MVIASRIPQLDCLACRAFHMDERGAHTWRASWRSIGLRRGIKIGAGVLAVLLIGYFAYVALRQEKGPSGASTPSTMAELPTIMRNEVTITCGPEIVGARGDVFGTSTNVPRWIGSEHRAVDWNSEYLLQTEDVLREHMKLVGPRVPLRFGYEPFDGFIAADGKVVQGYHWKDALNEKSSDMSIDEFMEYASRVGAEPQVVVNFGTGTAQEAADLVAYVNGTDNSDPMVALRRERGRPEPWGVKAFEIGSRTWMPGSVSFERFPDSPGGSRDPQALGRRQVEFARAMRGRSPTAIKLLAPISNWELDAYPRAGLRRLVSITAPEVDGYSLSFDAATEPGQAADQVALRPALLGERISELSKITAEEGGGKGLEIAVTEWAGSRYPSAMGRNWLTGVTLADSMLVAADRGVSRLNYFAAASATGDSGGYSYWLDGDPLRPAPTLTTTQVMARHLGRELLDTRTEGVEKLTAELPGGGASEFPALGVRCSRRDYDASLIVINRTSKPRQSNVSLDFRVIAPIQQIQLVAPTGAESVDAAAITYQPATKFSLDLPPYSVTLLQIPSV